MTLNEAISYCENEVRQNEKFARNYQPLNYDDSQTTGSEFRERARLYALFAGWLNDLQEYRELLKLALEDMIGSADCCACQHDNDGTCPNQFDNCQFKWRFLDRVEKLLERSDNYD